MSPELFAVCPHDTARGFDKWAMLNTFVNKHVGLQSKFNLYLDFAEFSADLEKERFTWAYLNPADYLKACARFGYAPVGRPIGRFDIAYVIAPGAGGEPGSLGRIAGKRLAAVKGYLFFLVKHQLETGGVPFDLIPAKSYAEVTKHVENGDADFGVTYNEHFDLLAPAARERFHIVERVHPGVSHVVVVHPSVPAQARQALSGLLLGAAALEDGKKVLAELKMTGFEAVPESPFLALKQILESASA